MTTAQGPSNATAPLATPPRPIAATRQRRAESFRSIQSFASEESSTYGPSTPSFLPRPPVPFQTPLSYQAPGRPGISPPLEPEVPTALLDLDFVVIRANTSFQQIMADDRDLTQSRLHDIAAPADSESFKAIQARLRGEREAREPSYLPPIIPSGEDPLRGVSDADIDRFTQGFSDQTYNWIQLKPGPRGSQVFPARVRLARATTYFAVVTLPSFRPLEPPRAHAPIPQTASFVFGPPLPPTEQALREHQRQMTAHSAPPSYLPYPYESMQSPAYHSHGVPTPAARAYPPPPPPPPPPTRYPQTYQQPYQQPVLPSQPMPEPPSEYRPPTTSSRTQPPPYGLSTFTAPPPLPPASSRDVQLPPIAASPASGPAQGPPSIPPIQEGLTSTVPGGQRHSESDEDSEGRRLRSPRKRRRMGIDEVLQK